MIRPESQTAPVDPNASGTNDQHATRGPNAFQASTNVANKTPTAATTPPLTSVTGFAPQAIAWGNERGPARPR